MILKLFFLLSSLIVISSCAGDGLFDKKTAPLPGNRVNVLHYEVRTETKAHKTQIKLSKQADLNAWSTSDVGQFTGLATNIQLPDNLKLSQKFKISNFSKLEHNSAIMVVEDILYNYSNGTLSSYQNGKNLWSIKLLSRADQEDILGGAITYYNKVIYISSGTRIFLAVNAVDGKKLWKYKFSNVIRAPALIYEDKIYITSVDNKLSCLDLKGNLLWLYNAPSYALARSRIYSPSIVYEDKIITVTSAGDVAVVNRHNGEELTQVNISANSIIGDGSLSKGPIVSPILVGNNLYILNSDGSLIKIDLQRPEIMWRQNFSNAISLWATGNVIYLLTDDHQLLAIEDQQGDLIWSSDIAKYLLKEKKIGLYGPILVNNKLMLTKANGESLFFSPFTGEKLDQNIANKLDIARMPIVANQKIYFISKAGQVAVWQ